MSEMKILRALKTVSLAIALLGFLAPASAQEFVAIPSLTAHVTDQVGMLNAGQRSALENVLSEYEKRSGSQIAVVLVSSTAPETIEQYSIRLADAWKLGRKGVDDGVILLVAKNNTAGLGRLRIETGRGVQGVLTDAQSKRILQDVIAPHFRQDDFYGGLAAGVSAITSLLDKEAFPAPQQGTHKGQNSFSWSPFLLFLFIIIITIARSRGGRGPRGNYHIDNWGNAGGVILGSAIGSRYGSQYGGSSGSDYGGFGGGGFGGLSGGGGGFDGGGASGNW